MKAKLVLEDGTTFEGTHFGYKKNVCGEVVFNTGMTGYVEALSDPSYFGQILVLTYPLIGNYGVPELTYLNELPFPFESDKPQILGLVVSHYESNYSHPLAVKTLDAWLKEHKIPAIYGIDTRELTKKIRENGTSKGLLKSEIEKYLSFEPNYEEKDFMKWVSSPIFKYFGEGEKRVIVVDCGVKNNIIRNLVRRNIRVETVPWNFDFNKIDENDIDGILLSNGPGNPKVLQVLISNVKKFMKICKKPILGICLGNQILALAAGGDTFKLPYGHRSQNQPVRDTLNSKCYITSQNHGYAVETGSLPNDWEESFVNINDGTNEGVRHKTNPWVGVQFHPEGFPGPCDTDFIFDQFVSSL